MAAGDATAVVLGAPVAVLGRDVIRGLTASVLER
jgi:hypothetical protein